MIIAIDESGNFNKNSNEYNLFVAAHIQSQNGNLEIKRKQFKSWSDNIPTNMRDKKGEIKGQLLGKVELKNFIKNVVYQSPEIRFTYISIIPKKNKIEIINKHKNSEVLQLHLSVENFIKANSKKLSINRLDQLAKWVNKRNEIEYLKLVSLKNCLYNSFVNSFTYCIAVDFPNELLDLEFKIDKDFISNEDKSWKLYLLRSLKELAKEQPLPMPKEWPQNHPVREKYTIPPKGLDLKISFQDNLRFLDSKEHFEIQIVDIAAIIFNRHWNGNGIKSHYESLRNKKAARENHHHLLLDDFDFEKEIEKIKLQMY